MDLPTLIDSAAPLGGGIAVVMVVLAIIGRLLRDRSRERRDAIARADPQALPKIVGDELDKLGLSAEGLTREQRFSLVSETLAQRERRSQRLLAISVVVAALLAVVTIVGVLVNDGSPADTKRDDIIDTGVDIPEGFSLEQAMRAYASSSEQNLVIQPGCESLLNRQIPPGPLRARDDTLLLNAMLVRAGLRPSEARSTLLPGGGYEIRC